MKYTDEYVKNICVNKDLEFINTETIDINNKRRKVCNFICLKHRKYGIQQKAVEKMESTKKPCCYCNHSKLNETIQDEIDPRIELLGKYKNYDTIIPCRCKIHNEYFDGIPAVILHGGTGCKICAHVKLWDSRGRRTKEEAKRLLEEVNENIIVTGEYQGSHKYIECKCKIHDYTWSSKFCNLLNKTATCPMCSLEHAVGVYRLTDDDVLQRLKVAVPHINPVGKYIGKDYDMMFHCTIHDQDFITKPKSLFYGKSRGCPLCTASNGETKLQNILNKRNINIKTQHIFPDCKNIKVLKFDAYDTDNNIAYEYQGEQHYYPVNFGGMSDDEAEQEFLDLQKRDQIKLDYCNNNHIPLIRIPYWEYNNMEEFIDNELKKIC